MWRGRRSVTINNVRNEVADLEGESYVDTTQAQDCIYSLSRQLDEINETLFKLEDPNNPLCEIKQLRETLSAMLKTDANGTYIRSLADLKKHGMYTDKE